jgi:hypothetical protein
MLEVSQMSIAGAPGKEAAGKELGNDGEDGAVKERSTDVRFLGGCWNT